MGRVGWQNGSWGNRIQWLVAMVVESTDRSFTCWLGGGDCRQY